MLVASLAPRVARAEVPLDLSWSAPSGCPQAGDVRERIRAIAGEALRGMTRLRADGRIARLEGRYQLTLKVYEGGEARERTIESSSCADLAGAAAVSLGLLLRNGGSSAAGADTGTNDRATDGAAGSSDETARQTEAGDSAPAQPRRTESSPAADRESPSASRGGTDRASPPPGGDAARSGSSARLFRVFLRAPALASAFGRLPAPQWGFGGAVGVRYEQWRLGVDARIFAEQSLWSSPFPDIGVKVSPRAVSLSACRGFRRGTLELGPCLSLGVEQARMRGIGPHVSARHETVTSFVFGAGGAAQLYLSEWMALVGAANIGLATARPKVVIDGLGDVRQLGPIKLELLLGPEIIF